MNARPNSRSVLTAASIAVALLGSSLSAQIGPEITSWRTNLNGARGSSIDATIHTAVAGVAADVQSVQYDTTDVYIRSTTVPSHNVGPFPGNPNRPGNTNSIFRITRNPQKATQNTATGLGPIGVFVGSLAASLALGAWLRMGLPKNPVFRRAEALAVSGFTISFCRHLA